MKPKETKPKRRWGWIDSVIVLELLGSQVFLILMVVEHFKSPQPDPIKMLLLGITGGALMMASNSMMETEILMNFGKRIDRLKEQLDAAMREPRSLIALRADVEHRLNLIEQEQERWPKMLTNTLMLAPIAVAAITALVYLGATVLKSLLGLSRP